MSDDVLSLIPTDPTWVPTRAQAADAAKALRDLAPRADVIEDRLGKRVQLFDAGANFESVRCPSCKEEIPMHWWTDALTVADTSQFTELKVKPPCCGKRTSLNDLDYRWPQGFARWVLSAENPDRKKLTAKERAVIEKALGHPVREIWAHY